MPFTDPVSSVSGRNSRASNVSGATGASRSVRSPPPSMPPNDTLANAGVLSMLKTSTDTGDIGALSFNSSRLPSMPRATHQRRGHASRPSISAQHMSGTTSNHSYAPSQASRISSQWDAQSTQRRGSLTSMQSMPPSLPPVHLGKPSLHTMPPTPDNPREPRSYSMTSAAPSQQLPRHRSATSLKSQGHEPRNGSRPPPGPVPPMPENRGPFVYPTRLKRPGYRSPSPALSDTYPHVVSHNMPLRAPMASPPHQPSMQGYGGYYGHYPGGYAQDPRHLNVRPPPRTATNSPGAYDPNVYNYRTGSIRGGVPPMMQQGMPQMMHPQHPQHPMQPPHPSMLPRGGYNAPQYGPPRPGHAYPQAPHAGYRHPPPSNVGPMAHQMFHNAARMARHLPHRTDTPMTDVPSSDPASSSSAPDSSNPPTPKDHTTIQVVVDPAFINPDLVDLPDSSSEPVLPAKYFDYADGLEKPIHEPDIEVPHPSVPPSGFVQRVKAMLESKAGAEAAAKREHERGNRLEQSMLSIDADQDQEDVSELMELHELAANEASRFTIIEEFEAPVELPASPVKIPELEATEPGERHAESQRLTRELVKAELGPSSPDNTQAQLDDTTTRMILGLDQATQTAEEAMTEAACQSGPSSQRSSDEKRRQESVAETVATESVAASLPTTADYVMQFQGPMDTTVASDETQSNNPFALDADTITIQHTKGSSPERLSDIKECVTPEPPQDQEHYGDQTPLSPVSPLRPGEIVKRSSAVSPVQTEVTNGIDETLRLANDERTETNSVGEQSNFESSQPAEPMPPPTPRTPKTYSKSVQLRPSVTITDSNSTGSNRFSLPGDLSTVGDTTFNSASDMVTDIAVRFSLPQTTITVGKPQIIDVSTSSTPDRAKQEVSFGPSTQNADLKAARRSSVMFADEVASLNINKKPEQHRPLQGAEASMAKGKSIIRRSSPRDDIDFSRISRDSTIDTRFTGGSNLNGINNRFGSTHLPGLKEESIEDMSISDHKRVPGGSNGDQFPLPARIAAVKAMQERRLQESADKAKARRQARQHNRPLADTRDLPSLNFSRTDLIDRLNEALEVRSATSMDIVRRRDFTGIHCPSPQRPLSTEPLRERYTSFFSKPEEFTFLDDQPDSEDEEDDESEPEPEHNNEKALVPTLQIQEQTEIEGVEPEKRPLSPEDFLNVASQVQRLSIPNVNGLSDRLSELIPGLRNLSNLQLDNIFANASSRESLRRSLEAARPDTLMTNRTSAGFRTLAERAEEIVKNGTHDSVAAHGLALNKDLPPLPESASVDKISGNSSPEGKQAYLSGSVSAPVDLGKGPSHPASALLRTKVPTTEAEVQQLLPKEMNPITRNARKSMIASQHTSRPWNQDENYPWTSKIEIDLSVPSPAHTRNSLASEVLRERRTKSLDLNQSTEPTDTTKDVDIGSLIDTRLERSASVTTEQATGITPQHARKISKRSIIGSITRKFGLSTKTTADEDTTTKSLPSRSPLPARASTQQSHKPGDRYPTSALTPPAGFNLDEVRSFFSDNSSERDRTASFRKRLTHFKGKGKAVARSSEPVRGTSLDDTNTAYDGASLVDARVGANSRAHTYDGVGMSKTEFHIKRFGEKLRHLFARGGELIRSLSARGKGKTPEHAQDEWLADSLYSGV
ncbi:Hypothetical predicted protein [Lecanosticta acicola]|uniref:Uncharacterized protein n=1 Tax=Lecanosticta acicola TaxID=111012 RepID=A0AAI9EA94_9PEZI|nr:Hypothetical predicted protein [Lecanosticta acicola]